jgi:hypothetical protein
MPSEQREEKKLFGDVLGMHEMKKNFSKTGVNELKGSIILIIVDLSTE